MKECDPNSLLRFSFIGVGTEYIALGVDDQIVL